VRLPELRPGRPVHHGLAPQVEFHQGDAGAQQHSIADGGAGPTLLDDARDAVAGDVAELRDLLERIGSDEWYPQRDPATGEYDVDNIRSTDWLIDQIVYRLYGLTDDEVRTVEEAFSR
jgi:hypothetical protein